MVKELRLNEFKALYKAWKTGAPPLDHLLLSFLVWIEGNDQGSNYRPHSPKQHQEGSSCSQRFMARKSPYHESRLAYQVLLQPRTQYRLDSIHKEMPAAHEYLTRGSRKAYIISTPRFTTTTKKAANTMQASTSG